MLHRSVSVLRSFQRVASPELQRFLAQAASQPTRWNIRFMAAHSSIFSGLWLPGVTEFLRLPSETSQRELPAHLLLSTLLLHPRATCSPSSSILYFPWCVSIHTLPTESSFSASERHPDDQNPSASLWAFPGRSLGFPEESSL